MLFELIFLLASFSLVRGLNCGQTKKSVCYDGIGECRGDPAVISASCSTSAATICYGGFGTCVGDNQDGQCNGGVGSCQQMNQDNNKCIYATCSCSSNSCSGYCSLGTGSCTNGEMVKRCMGGIGKCLEGDGSCSSGKAPIYCECSRPLTEYPVQGTCDMYDCLQDLYQCNSAPNDYPINYGKKYCERFRNLAGVSNAVLTWRDATLSCLQNALKSFLVEPPVSSCSRLTTVAFDSHPGCYTQARSSICLLTPLDWAKIFNVVDLADSISLRSLKQMVLVALTCTVQIPLNLFRLVLDGDIAMFDSAKASQFSSDIAGSINVSPSRVQVVALTPGSVSIAFILLDSLEQGDGEPNLNASSNALESLVSSGNLTSVAGLDLVPSTFQSCTGAEASECIAGSTSSSDSKIPIIIGASIGGAVLLIAIVALVIVLDKKRKSTARGDKNKETSPTKNPLFNPDA